ncbi:MAG: hypothetical protein MUF44_09050 [Hydrogenophaga sp.]|nr:hypothetical protein [Hydrogenophaga sp.]
MLKLVAQHAVARGLEQVPSLPNDITLKFRLVSALLPEGKETDESALDAERLLAGLNRALDRFSSDPRKAVLHLTSQPPLPD